MTQEQLVKQRVAGFERLYDAFFAFAQDYLRKDASKFGKYYLQLQARFFDDLVLQKTLLPVFGEFVSNLEEKRSCAQAALYDALVAHTFGSYLGQVENTLHERLTTLEQDTAKGIHALHLLLNQEVAAVKTLIPAKAAVKEPKKDAISKGKQTGVGPQDGQQK